jgi:hypothetical protein
LADDRDRQAVPIGQAEVPLCCCGEVTTMPPMTPSRLASMATAQIFRWEIGWLAVEVIGVALGLGLMLGTELDEAGGGLLFLVCGISFFVRSRHYIAIRRQR